jgi:transglutaminase-like putative cysteine protease
MKNFLIALAVFMQQNTVCAQLQMPFAVSHISDSLRSGTEVVYRFYNTDIHISSASRYTITEQRAVTLFSKSALQEYGTIVLPSDKHIKLEEAEVKIYDSMGVERSRYKKKDFSLIASPLNDALVSDNKYYYLSIGASSLPLTIVISSTIELNGYVDFPDWYAAAFDAAYEQNTCKITVPTELGIRYKAFNTSIQPKITSAGSLSVYEWKNEQQKMMNREPGSMAARYLLPRVAIAPNLFEYDDYRGSFKTWKDYGQWYYHFYEEKEPFKPEITQRIRNSVAHLNTPAEKVSFLYKKMQEETRYVSIQLGIGGLKPFPASFVEEKKYGDCKALSNYMKHLLKTVGINSYAAIIKSGANASPADVDFPNEGFDHVILCVPVENDTLWLECTSKLTPPGIPGNFTENRNALLVTEKGGVLVNTPKSKSEHNQWRSSSTIEIFEDGGAIIESRIWVTGEFFSGVNYLLLNKSKDEYRKALVNVFDFKAPDDLELTLAGDSANGKILLLKFAYGRFYDFQTGKKFFFPFRHYKISDENLKPSGKRTSDYLFSFPYVKTDTIVYRIPAAFTPENPIPFITTETPFCKWNNNYRFDEKQRTITIATTLSVQQHVIPAAGYEQTASFFQQVKKDENQKLVLRKE